MNLDLMRDHFGCKNKNELKSNKYEKKERKKKIKILRRIPRNAMLHRLYNFILRT